MVSQNTLDTINYVKDIEYEYNIKILVLFTMLIYALVMFYLSYNWDKDKYYAKLLRVFVMRIPSFIYILSFPLLFFFLQRGFSYEVIFIWLVTVYGFFLVILFIAAKLGAFELAAEMLELEIKPSKMKINKRFDYSKKW